MGDQHHTNMAGGGGAADALISSFKKFPYRTKHAVLREEGYRLATVYETKQLLEAIRSTEGGGVKLRAKQWNVVEHELVPEGEEEAYRLQDGYLLDFGTLRTFYRDISDKFSISHKLCVSLSHSDLNDTRSIKLWLPLALLHACAEQDGGEIQWLVEEGTRIQGNISNIGLVSTTKEDDLLVQMQDPASTGSVQESTQGMNMSPSSARTGDDEIENRNSGEAASPGLALLCSGTPWVHGGTAFHFCVWAKKGYSAQRLLDLAQRLPPQQLKAKEIIGFSKLVDCKDNENSTALSWAAAVELFSSHWLHHCETTEEMFKLYEYRPGVPFPENANVFGISESLRRAKEAEPMTPGRPIEHMWRLSERGGLRSTMGMDSPGSYVQFKPPPADIKSVRESLPHLFNPLDGNSFMHYLVLRPDFDVHHMKALERANAYCGYRFKFSLAEFAFGMENHRGSTSFQMALSRGRSEICEWVLDEYPGSPTEFANRALAIRDCEGRNMLHLYAEGGASKEVGRMILDRLKAAEEELTDLSLPLFLRRAKDAGKIKELLNELNAEGDTPCTVALRKGHSDALQLLMPWWGEELAMRYRHPLSQDSILHCYAKSTNPGAICFEWSSFFSAPSSLPTLLSAHNAKGNTPLLSALLESDSENTAAFACLLRLQEGDSTDVFGSWKDRVLDMYAEKFDDEELAREVLQKLGIDVEPSENAIRSAVSTAIQKGHARTACDAFLAALSGGTPDRTAANTALLRPWLGGMGRIRDPQDKWEKLKPYICENELMYHVRINPSMYANALVGALETGNVKACEWLLKCVETHAGVGGLRGYLIKNKGFINDKTFESFAKGDCKDQNLWDKLKKGLDFTSERPSTSSAASPATHDEYEIESLLSQRVDTNSSSGVDCALCFLRNPGLASGALRWMSQTSLKSFKVLAHMKRHKYYCHIFRRPDILQLAAEFKSFEFFEMALQAQTHERIENLSNIDGLIADIISKIPLSSSNCFLQVLSMRLAEEKCSPLIVSWKRLVQSGFKNWDEIGRRKAWLWASMRHSQAGSFSSIVWNESTDIGSSTSELREGQQHAASRPEESKAVPEQREKVLQVEPTFTEQQQRAYLKLAQGEDYASDITEVLALGNIIIKQLGPTSSASSNALQLLRKMSSPHPTVLAQFLFLISHDKENEAAPGFDTKLLPELLDAFSVDGKGKLLPTLLNHAITHQKSSSFLNLKKFLASPASLWTDQVEQNTLQNRTTPLHQLVLSKRDRRWDSGGLLGEFINGLSYFRFFQVDDVRDYTGATALHVACREQMTVCARVLLAMSPQLATLGRRTGITALHDSAHSGYLEMVKEILRFRREANALLDERDADGKTALHFAAASRSPNSIEIVKLLLAHAKENGDYAALLLWASAGSAVGTAYRVAKDGSDVAILLQEEMKNASDTGQNLLELAIHKGSDIMVRELINRGAEIQPDFVPGIQKTFDTRKESDQPAKTDSLGRGPLAKGIAALLLNPFTAVPITVGVFGPWGMGKSSVMLQTEIAMTMTMIENNLLPMEPSTEDTFPGCREKREAMTWKGKEVCHQLRTALEQASASYQHSNLLRSTPFISTVSTRIKLLFKKLQKKLCFWSSWTTTASKKSDEKFLQDLVSHYNEELKPLYKGLSLIDRQNLFHHHYTFEQENVLNLPSCITIFYNAWLYSGEKEASSGLAFTIMKELEEYLNTAQWLRLCWRYAYKSDPVFFFSNITLPLILCLCIGSWVLWIMWKLLSLPSIANNKALNNFRYGSLPIAMVISTWVILRNVLNVVKPVSEQAFKSLHTKTTYEAKLGYHQQIIDDIEFFKEELCQPPSFIWKCCGKLWSIFVENKDNIPLTSIRKTLIQKKSLRIVVFVDDLDRCTEPIYILQLLGAINLILSACSINVVIGMDKGRVEGVLKKVYEEGMESSQKFIEKIVQLPLYLSEANEQEMSSFVQEHLLGKLKSRKGDSTSLNNINDSPTTQMRRSFSTIANVSYSNEGYIAIVTEDHPCSMEDFLGQPNNHILSGAANLSRASIPDRSPHEMEPSNDAETMQDKQDLDRLEGNDKLAIKSYRLVPNYTKRELETFEYLQSRAKVENRQPRNWKRFLNYHRLSWYIISQTKSKILRVFSGWQEQLIIWVFICYNWEHEMNEIFQNWKELLEEILREPTNDAVTLHQVISLYMKKNSGMKSMKELADTISTVHDIELRVGIFFQSYRFHCARGQLDWEND